MFNCCRNIKDCLEIVYAAPSELHAKAMHTSISKLDLQQITLLANSTFH